MKCFGLPKLGSYVAVPVRYPSCLHANGVEDAPPPPEPVAADDVDPDAAPPPEPEVTEAPPKFAPVNVTSEYIIGFDTVGQGREFSSSEKAFARAWASKLADASSAAELKLWNADIDKLEAMAGAEADLTTDIAAKKEAAMGAIAEKITAEAGDDEAKKEFLGVSLKAAALAEVIVGVQDSVLSLSALSIPPKDESIKALSAVMVACGVEKSKYTDMLTGKVMWGGLSALITADLIASMTSDPVSAEVSEQIKAAGEGVDATSVPWGHVVATSCVAGLLLEWANAKAEEGDAKVTYDAKLEEMKAAQADAGDGGD